MDETTQKYKYIGVIVAAIFLYKEILGIVTRFYNQTLSYFSLVNNIQSTDFLSYMTSILLILLVFYLFFGIGGKFKSPLISISEIIQNLASKIKNNIDIYNKVGIILIIGLLFIFVVWFSRYIINGFLQEEYLTLIEILYNILTIAVYFFISYLGTERLYNAVSEFMENETGFWKIGLIVFFYIIFLGSFYDISGYAFSLLKTM